MNLSIFKIKRFNIKFMFKKALLKYASFTSTPWISKQKIRSAVQIIAGGHVIAAAIATYTGNETWYRYVIMPTLRLLNAEHAHVAVVTAARFSLIPNMRGKQKPSISLVSSLSRVRVWSVIIVGLVFIIRLE